MYMYINGDVIKEDEARISPFDHGFLYGMGLFETFRIYEGHPFLLLDHLERLNQGLAVLGIERNISKEEVIKALELLLERNKLENAYIRLNVSAGVGEVGLQTDPYTSPNIMMFVKPLKQAEGLYAKEAQYVTVRRNTPEGSWRLKSHHYMNNLLAKKEIGKRMDVEGFFLTQDGFLAEGIVSNIFWVIDNTLYTPAVQTGILNGVTRSFVLELASNRGLSINEGFYTPDLLLKASEVFVTNSIQEIVPITKLESVVYPGADGEFVQALFEEYRLYTKNLWTRNEIKHE